MTQLDLQQHRGLPVLTYDDERLGTLVDVRVHAGKRYLVVEGDLVGTGRYWVPEDEVQRIGPERILLRITRDDLPELDWLNPPE